jgi:cytochrome b
VTSRPAPSQRRETVRVWDPFVRTFHWSLVACVLIDYFVVDDGKTLHQWLGHVATALVVARIVWGFVGTRHARFADFLPTPRRVRTHVRAMLSGQPTSHPGHNPLGAIVMFGLIALVLLAGLTGFLQTTDAFWGEEWLQETHRLITELLIGTATLHALAAIVMSRIERTNLVAAMITGVKVRPGGRSSVQGREHVQP